jgi:hypothetical protein
MWDRLAVTAAGLLLAAAVNWYFLRPRRKKPSRP